MQTLDVISVNLWQILASLLNLLILFLIVKHFLYKPVKTLGNTLTHLQNIFVALGRVFELFDLQPEIVDLPDAKKLEGLNNDITFENVTFGYVPEHTVIKNLNLRIPKNETLAIVGNSGGGKSLWYFRIIFSLQELSGKIL